MDLLTPYAHNSYLQVIQIHMGRIDLAQDRDQRRAFVSTVMNLWIH
jgi:hypothetical protein